MNLIKVGSQVLNLDQITHFSIERGSVVWYLPHTDADGIADYGHTVGHEAEALRSWLDTIAVDVVAVYESGKKKD